MSSESISQNLLVLSGILSQVQIKVDYGQTGSHAVFFLEREQLASAVNVLFDQGYFLEDISGLDLVEGVMVVYHFDRYDRSERVVLRVLLPHAQKRVTSISGIFSGADWHERETFDFFGVVFENHPNLKPLLLPDDLGFHPLLKDKDRKSIYSVLPFDQTVQSKF